MGSGQALITTIGEHDHGGTGEAGSWEHGGHRGKGYGLGKAFITTIGLGMAGNGL
jgi:hypothetical protein